MTKKKEEVVEQTILKNSLEEIMADRFARYSKYIIQERALPDARDGLKPVQRRILWAMYEDGNTFNKPYHKSAKTVGNVIGNYHPHGDSSVYDAMVRLSQDWKISTPLVDMQGNNGSIDDDPAAAMRYTEARLSKVANYLLQDIDKETVEWAPNFSDEKMEPTVLPARFPNLLTMGITGIAAGYATNIPPHNFNEIVNAAIHRIQNPDCTLDDLMQYVKGPDYPTGGIVMGYQGIKEALSTGRGKVIIRSKTEIRETKTVKQIIVREIPYEVVKSQLVRKIDDIRLNKKIDGILDVRDESDRNGLKIVIDVKLNSAHEQILNYLYKNTDLQISYNYNMIAIVNKAPVLMSLITALDAFIAHREDVVLRRSKHDLRIKKDRAHILEGLIRAVSVMDEIIAIIRKSKDKAHAKKNLIARFDFTEPQAEAIVVMRLYRLTNTDVKELKAEFKELKAQIKALEAIVSSKERLHEVLVEELQEINSIFEVPRRSQIEHQVEDIVIDHKAMIADEQVILPVTRDGYVKKVSLRSFNASNDSVTGRKDSDTLLGWAQVSTLDTLLFFTSKGTYGYIPVYSIEEAKWKDLGSHLSAYIRMDGTEKIVSAYILKNFDEKVHVVMATRYGMIKRMTLKELQSSRTSRTMTAMKVGSMDEMIAAQISVSDEDLVYLFSEKGNALNYPVSSVPLSGARSKGVKSMNLVNEDTVACMKVVPEGAAQILVVTTQAQMKRIRHTDIPRVKRPAKGNRICKLVKSNPALIHSVYFGFANSEISMWDEQIHSVLFKDVPMMSPDSTFSSPFGKISNFEIVQTIETIEQGQWESQISEPEQETLFDDEESF